MKTTTLQHPGARENSTPKPQAINSRRPLSLQFGASLVVGTWCLALLTASVRGQSALDGFDPNANSLVTVVVVQPDGKILLGGNFTTLSPNGGAAVPRNRIARLNPDGTLDTAFNPNANAQVNAIALQADGKSLAGGFFSGANSIGGQRRNYIARLDPTTGAADSFNPNANNYVDAIVVQADGKIVLGGLFHGASSIGGQTRNYIARLDPTTGAADSLDPNANYFVHAIAVQADGKILACGSFNGANSIGGQTRNYIARLDGTTGLADAFDPNASGDSFPGVGSIAVQADGKILVGGSFTNIGGQPRNNFARLSNDTAALQNLTATQTTITWARSGSSPQFTRVTFEDSTDNVNVDYNFLGAGMAAGGNWTLTGLNLPTGQSFYIRARGYYRGGLNNGSESITESVWNTLLVVPTSPPRLNIQRGANTDVVLSWAASFAGFTLEANPNLNPTVWSIVSPAPVVSGTNNVVTNAVSGSTRFYRLRK